MIDQETTVAVEIENKDNKLSLIKTETSEDEDHIDKIGKFVLIALGIILLIMVM
ncbi:hypothetical protein GW820_07185 [archaeon]|nr:hypothetical protein [archaeon]